MRYLFFVTASACLFTLLSCGDGASADTTNLTEPAPAENSTVLPANVTATVDTTKPITTVQTPIVTAGLNPAHGQPGHRCDIAVGAPLNSAPIQQPVSSPTMPVTATTTTTQLIPPATVTTVAPGMNPAHGQPGHRCDIAVGAPLNSEPVQVKSQPVTTSTPPVTSTKVAPGMNPPHGQPGHRCDIAVGAPLNSKPVQQAVTTTPLPLTSPTTTTTTTPPVATTKVAPGMNPAHGQPGHRCDIAVGAPLNSKPDPQTAIKTQTLPTITPIQPVPDTKPKQQ